MSGCGIENYAFTACAVIANHAQSGGSDDCQCRSSNVSIRLRWSLYLDKGHEWVKPGRG